MKKLLVFLLLFCSSIALAQNDSLVKNVKDRKKGYELLISGNWNKTDIKVDKFATHFPTYTDEYNNLMEFSIVDSNEKNVMLGNSLRDIKFTYLRYFQRLKCKIISSEKDTNNKYYIYKLTMYSKLFNKNIIINYLIGFKKPYAYAISLYNYDGDVDMAREFLIQTFENN